MENRSIQEKSINAIKFLAVDGVQNANSGHPGLPLGCSGIAYALWMKILKYNPKNPKWYNRDRFVLSGGHGSMLLYTMLHLTGYDISMDDLKSFRQWGSITPGHPEYGMTPGVEVTTGPLGQGFGNGVGMAIAEAHLAAVFNRPGYTPIDHFIYSIVTDGDLMEGIASEAASLAGHLKLGKLIYFYDDNRISIDGPTSLAFTEDRAKRFEAYGWHVAHVNDPFDVDALVAAVDAAKADERPSLIIVRTTIGDGLPSVQGTEKAHGSPPGWDEIATAKQNAGWPADERFYVPDDVREHFSTRIEVGRESEEVWEKQFEAYEAAFPELANELIRRINGDLPENWEESLPVFPEDEKGMATRAASGKVLNALAKALPELMGGSADLAPSNKTWINGELDFQTDTPQGRNMHFGVREHAMGSIVNGMSVHGGLIPYGGTFLVFSDYMRGAVRLSALSEYPTIWVFTHDSIGVGEDGPTHQPVEHTGSLRIIPNLVTIRPADANETAQAWRFAIQHHGPVALILSRQNLPTIDRNTFSEAEGLFKGAYVLADMGQDEPELILMASGSEVDLILRAASSLAAEGVNVRVVSFPSWEIFSQQDQTYKDQVLPPNVRARIAVEAGSSMGWHRWVGDRGKVIGIDKFGASAPGDLVMENYGFTVANVIDKAFDLLQSVHLDELNRNNGKK
ncbi:MAG: transketolase [Brevefilum sp.]|nr:transketolase [Brevefilum sp.]MDT8380871.1 transketolase [Brevefilum sp.]MDW7754869.1 transketolase [Brevefilum sp.]